VPHAVRIDGVTGVVDEDVERQARVLDVAADLLGPLRDDGNDLDAARSVLRGVFTSSPNRLRQSGHHVPR
jgi:hypothetical protein